MTTLALASSHRRRSFSPKLGKTRNAQAAHSQAWSTRLIAVAVPLPAPKPLIAELVGKFVVITYFIEPKVKMSSEISAQVGRKARLRKCSKARNFS